MYILYLSTDVNVGIGLGLFTDKYTLKSASISLWIFIGYVCIIIILEVVLHVVFTISAFSAPIEGIWPACNVHLSLTDE